MTTQPEVFSPVSLEDACRVLEEHPDAIPMAGCTDLLVSLELGGERPRRVLDLLGLPELQGISETDGGLRIGATVCFSDLSKHELVRSVWPALAAAAGTVGGWQIRNRATLGGNLATASPAGDSLPVLLALDARVVLAGPGGLREVRCDDFFLGYRRTALRPGEIIAFVDLPLPPEGAVQAFRKVGTRQAQAISKVVVAMRGLAHEGRIQELRLAAGSVAPTPVRLHSAEKQALLQSVGEETAALVGRAAASEVQPIDDVRSDSEYRSFALEGVVRRFVLLLGQPH